MMTVCDTGLALVNWFAGMTCGCLLVGAAALSTPLPGEETTLMPRWAMVTIVVTAICIELWWAFSQ